MPVYLESTNARTSPQFLPSVRWFVLKTFGFGPFPNEQYSKQMAFFLQAVRIGNVQSYGIQLIQDQIHPVIVAQAHYRRIEKEHVVKGVGHHHALRVPPFQAGNSEMLLHEPMPTTRQDPISSMNFIAVHPVWGMTRWFSFGLGTFCNGSVHPNPMCTVV